MGRDIKINLNTGQGEVLFVTEEIKGVFHALVSQSEGRVEIAIESEQGYTIFHAREVFGTKYIPIRSPVFDKDYHTFKEFGNTPYYLREKLKIRIMGSANQEINLILKII